MADSFYITTPLYYVNDAPHIGHTYTTVAADVLARYHRLCGADVHFLTGTDEHGQKVMEAAEKRGLTPQAHADELVQRFEKLWVRLGITHDDFIRTTEERHQVIVKKVLQDLFDRGEIYQDSYSGWYSTSEERFWTEKDVIVAEDGTRLCPASKQPVQWIEEVNYFFRMSKYADQLRQWLADHPDWIQPEARRNELAGALAKEVGDLCISRPKERLSWGIPLPFDDGYVTYVWFDALLNYISAVGYLSDPATFEKRWPAQFQLLGKDILTTHTIYWGAMLFACGLDPADCLYAHGWWTIEGRKMSKSLGNVVDPNLLVDCYGSDSVRWVLTAEKAFGADGDFSHKSFQLRYNADLANKIGNLAHRSVDMTHKWLGGTVPALDAPTQADQRLQEAVAERVRTFRAELERLEVKPALEALVDIARLGNEYTDEMGPWALNKAGDSVRLAGVMRRLLELNRCVATLLLPICPERAQELLDRLGVAAPTLDGVERLDLLPEGAPVQTGDPLFPRMKKLPQAIADALAKVEGGVKSLPGSVQPKKKAKASEPPAEIAFEDFAKVAFKTGTVLSATKHPDADRLLVLQVDVGEEKPRQIVAGIASRYTPDELVGLGVIVVANLAPAQLRGVESQGMLLAAGSKAVLAMATTSDAVPPGTVVR